MTVYDITDAQCIEINQKVSKAQKSTFCRKTIKWDFLYILYGTCIKHVTLGHAIPLGALFYQHVFLF